MNLMLFSGHHKTDYDDPLFETRYPNVMTPQNCVSSFSLFVTYHYDRFSIDTQDPIITPTHSISVFGNDWPDDEI